MRKLFFLLVLVSGMLTAQTPNATNTQTIGKFLKLSKVPSGLETDNVLVRGTDGIVKFVPRSSIGAGSQVNADWNAVSGLSQILNKPQFRTINGQSIFGSTNLTISGGTSIAHLEFDNTNLTVWNNGKGNISTNTCFGENAFSSNINGTQNVAIGENALKLANYSSGNTAVGAYSMENTTSTSSCSAFGFSSLQSNTTGFNNTAVGSGAMFKNTTGYNNTAYGNGSLSDNTTGYNNISIGNSAGKGIKTGSGNVIIGGSSADLPSNLNNTIIIADGFGTERISINSAGLLKLLSTTPIYADNSAAIAGGLTAGNIYRLSTGQLMIVY